jgi:hypothetical protein
LPPPAGFTTLRTRNSWFGMTQAPVFPRFSPGSRLLVALLGLGILGLLVTASRLEPDPRGFGTHEQLGLTPCSFYRWTGRLCPTCGATTAWAHLLNGNWAAAVRANLAATMTAGLALIAEPWLLVSAVWGRWVGFRPSPRGLLTGATVLAAVAVMDWLGRTWR